MEVLSLGYRTDLLFHRYEGEVVERPDCLVIRTPEQPGYYWGNLLLFPSPPAPGDCPRWMARFREEFADLPGVRHQTFAWDAPGGETGDLDPFLAEGFAYDPGQVLHAREVHPPPRPLEELEVRPLRTPEEWQAAVECQVACRDPVFSEAAYREFSRGRMERLGAMASEGLGWWFGAFLDGLQVGSLGIYLEGEVGRFQIVGTLPEYRRRGVCGTLVHRSSLQALAAGARELVLVAELGSPAERVYGSVGYGPLEIQPGLCRFPPGVG